MLEILDHDRVRELRLARPPVNALSPALVSALRTALAAAEDRAACDAIVLSGQPGLFSAGLDVRELDRLEPAALAAFVDDFFALQRAIAASTRPIVAAITGHCPAGGTVLALYCDYRIMARGPYTIGLNEVQVGLYPGELIMRAFERLVGPRRCAELLMRGALLDPAAALETGLVDELAEGEVVRARALDYARELLALPRAAFARTRGLVRRDLVRLFDAVAESFAERFLEIWFSDETRARLQALLTRGETGRGRH
jgi:enoyl-CoA hydratase/carnithine racemase